MKENSAAVRLGCVEDASRSHHHARVDGGADGPAQGVPRLLVEPVVEFLVAEERTRPPQSKEAN